MSFTKCKFTVLYCEELQKIIVNLLFENKINIHMCVCVCVCVCVKLENRKCSLSGKNDKNALWH